jgi:AraC-like DNA-binding protein
MVDAISGVHDDSVRIAPARPVIRPPDVEVMAMPTQRPAIRDDLAWLRRARNRMDRDFAEPLHVPALAREALMSPCHFSRSFRAVFGETPYRHLMTRRIERAKALLRRGDLTVTEVCLAVGFTSLGSFSSRFTEVVGETPSAYRARTKTRAPPSPRDPPNSSPDWSGTKKPLSATTRVTGAVVTSGAGGRR